MASLVWPHVRSFCNHSGFECTLVRASLDVQCDGIEYEVHFPKCHQMYVYASGQARGWSYYMFTCGDVLGRWVVTGKSLEAWHVHGNYYKATGKQFDSAIQPAAWTGLHFGQRWYWLRDVARVMKSVGYWPATYCIRCGTRVRGSYGSGDVDPRRAGMPGPVCSPECRSQLYLEYRERCAEQLLAEERELKSLRTIRKSLGRIATSLRKNDREALISLHKEFKQATSSQG